MPKILESLRFTFFISFNRQNTLSLGILVILKFSSFYTIRLIQFNFNGKIFSYQKI